MYAVLPAPVEVECAEVTRGPLSVTVDEDGRTQIKERYAVSAPLSGRLARQTLHAGDPVQAGTTVIAAIEPVDPSLLDARARAESKARVAAAEAAVERADATLAGAAAAFELAHSESSRYRELAEKNAANQQELERAIATESIRSAEKRAADFQRQIARFELDLARAAVVRSDPSQPGNPDDWRLEIRSPVSGRVLRVLQESATIVSAGTPLVEVGDPQDLEARIDVLSTDAVGIRPGAPVSIEHWGGPSPLKGVVRTIEPAAFTKVSALGVEEQRVYVVIDFVGPPSNRPGLGDGFRVEGRIVVAETPTALKLPTGALFRIGDSWAVFAIESGRARSQLVQLGLRNSLEVEVVSGLNSGQKVIVYPGDLVHPGVKVKERRP